MSQLVADEPKQSQSRPGLHSLLPGQNPQGGPVLSVLLKRTYNIGKNGACQRSEEDSPLNPGDVPWDDPMNSSVRFESDFIPFKIATDVVLNGFAYAPKKKPCRELTADLQVGGVTKSIYVVGDRTAIHQPGREPRFTDPKPFDRMPLQYERAYGGIDVFSDRKNTYAYGRNPLGRGFVVSNSRETVQDKELPNIEDPNDRISEERFCVGDFFKNWERHPMPTSLGWFPKTWLPRASFAGIMPGDRATEQELRKTYGMLVPAKDQAAYAKTKLPDMDFRFFNGASAGLTVPYLRGDEKVAVKNLTEDGFLSFQLPNDIPKIAIDIGEGPKTPAIVMHTVMIHMEECQVDLVWRGAIDYPGLDWLPNLKKLEIVIQ